MSGISTRTIYRAIFFLTLLAAWLAPPASATITSQTMNGTATPTTQAPITFGGSSLRIDFDTTYVVPSSPFETISEAVIHFDNDFAFDTSGLGQCDPASIPSTTTQQAKALCPGAEVGTGTATACAANFGCAPSGVEVPFNVTAFNGTPAGASPRLLLHVRSDTAVTTLVITGTYGPSSRGGDFGTQLDLPIADTSGTALHITHLDFTLQNLDTGLGHHYLSARCNDADHIWNFAGDFSFRSGAGTFPASATQACVPGIEPPSNPGGSSQQPAGTGSTSTGRRAAALKKCKKKKGKARKNCIARAKKLPL